MGVIASSEDDEMISAGTDRLVDCRARMKLAAMPAGSALTVPILVR